MMAFQQILLALNALLALAFGVDYFIVESKTAKPRTKAAGGLLLCLLFLSFLILMLLFALARAFLERDVRYLALSVYVIIPFVIGRLASYRTLRFYAVLQMLALLASAATLHALALQHPAEADGISARSNASGANAVARQASQDLRDGAARTSRQHVKAVVS